MMKIKLIVPVHRRQNFKRFFQIAPLNLMILAALTPEEYDVEIVDENIDAVDYDDPVDLVGIGVFTSEAPRAYEISRRFREKGAAVVMGGIHSTVMYEEAGRYADSVVIGEAEYVWKPLLEDFSRNRLRKYYGSDTFPDMTEAPLPDRSCIAGKRYLTGNVCQITRGCPFRCVFCSVSRLYGAEYRMRDEKDVLREIESMEGDFVLFMDDNIFGNHDRAGSILRNMVGMNKKWVGQCTLDLADDKELLELARKSGCMGMFIGIESIDEGSLKASGKPRSLKDFRDRIERILDSGILIDGSFVFGFDNEDASIFERTLEFIMNTRLPAATFSVLTPYPGTKLRTKLEKEGRILHNDWEKYGGTRAVFRPNNMSIEELEEGFRWIKQEFYRFPNIIRRMGMDRDNLVRLWLYNLLKKGGTTRGRRGRAGNPLKKEGPEK